MYANCQVASSCQVPPHKHWKQPVWLYLKAGKYVQSHPRAKLAGRWLPCHWYSKKPQSDHYLNHRLFIHHYIVSCLMIDYSYFFIFLWKKVKVKKNWPVYKIASAKLQAEVCFMKAVIDLRRYLKIWFVNRGSRGHSRRTWGASSAGCYQPRLLPALREPPPAVCGTVARLCWQYGRNGVE